MFFDADDFLFVLFFSFNFVSHAILEDFLPWAFVMYICFIDNFSDSIKVIIKKLINKYISIS